MTQRSEVSAASVRWAGVLGWSEKQLQEAVVDAARRLGWSLVYHTFDSRRSAPGYPDLHLVYPARRLSMFRELKATRGRLTRDQRAWMDGLEAVGCDVDVWRPADWVSGRIVDELRGIVHGHGG